MPQLPSVTADNAAVDDTMIMHMEKILKDFLREANQTRCFAHIINLCAKSLLRPFNIDKRKYADALDEAEQALRDLADELDLEGLEAATNKLAGKDESDNVDGWVNKCELLSDEVREELAEDVYPVKMVLAKVGYLMAHCSILLLRPHLQLRKLATSIVYSPTSIHPQWNCILRNLKLKEKILPHDVRTRWNLTYRLLEAALKYRKAIDRLTSDCELGLWKLEIQS